MRQLTRADSPAEWLPEDHDEIVEEPVPLLDALAEAGGPAAEALLTAPLSARSQPSSALVAFRLACWPPGPPDVVNAHVSSDSGMTKASATGRSMGAR